MVPSLALRKPEMMEKSVVLPAPLGPISAVIRPSAAVSDAAFTANRPPKRRVTRSTTRRGSAMAPLLDGRGGWRGTARQPFAHLRKPADQAARCKPDDQHKHRAIDNQIKAGDIAGHEL